LARPLLIVDSMIVIEAVRTGCWKAITGQRSVVLVEECAKELRRGDSASPSYVAVSEADLSRARIEPVEPGARAEFRLTYTDADRLDPGERDVLAWASRCADEFEVCSSDKAALRAAHAMGWLDRVVSLEMVAGSVGARPSGGLKRQFTEAVMVTWRTSLRLS
jgi:hypothetical protein